MRASLLPEGNNAATPRRLLVGGAERSKLAESCSCTHLDDLSKRLWISRHRHSHRFFRRIRRPVQTPWCRSRVGYCISQTQHLFRSCLRDIRNMFVPDSLLCSVRHRRRQPLWVFHRRRMPGNYREEQLKMKTRQKRNYGPMKFS